MGVETEKYIRKPLYVDAVRVTAHNFDEIVAWCQGEVLQDEVPGSGTTKKYVKVRVHNPKNPRQTKAFIGDWILYTDRGYKVYTNKAFRAAFDVVDEQGTAVATPNDPNEVLRSYLDEAIDQWRAIRDGGGDNAEIAKFYIDAFQSVRQSIIGEVLPDTGTSSSMVTTPAPIEEVAQPAEPGLQQAALESGHPIDPDEPLVTPQGEPVEIVEATPQAIADVVNEQQPIAPPPTPAIIPPEPEARLQVETGAEHKIKHEPVTPPEQVPSVADQRPEVAASGKRVLSEEEQHQMGQDEVRELLKSGDVVLAQDLAESPQG